MSEALVPVRDDGVLIRAMDMEMDEERRDARDIVEVELSGQVSIFKALPFASPCLVTLSSNL